MKVEIIADSVTPRGHRLTTFNCEYWRAILAEVNTHRSMCLTGDTVLEFDLPAALADGRKQRHTMTIVDFVDKWINGARRIGANPKINDKLDRIESDTYYTPSELEALTGLDKTNINGQCRDRRIRCFKESGEWIIYGQDFLDYRLSKPEHTRFGMKDRLKEMQIRQLNEKTYQIQSSTICNVFESGIKEVYTLVAIYGDHSYTVSGSKDHKIFTPNGWKTIEELKVGQNVIVQARGVEKKKDPERLTKVDGLHRSQWQRKEKKRLLGKNPNCRDCNQKKGTEIHHIVPVHEDLDRTFDPTNITLLCENCHNKRHRTQGWQESIFLLGKPARITNIVFRGIEPTYDLEIVGQYPNFLANGVVVHNSRNSPSSRAIPVAKMIDRIKEDPAMPVKWTKNQAGMSAVECVDPDVESECKMVWLEARDSALAFATRLAALGLHKQITNRLLEPWMYTKSLISGTDWANFFHLRVDKGAQDDFQELAYRMLKLYLESEPRLVKFGDWHLPYADGLADLDIESKLKIVTARAARVSYYGQDGVIDPEADYKLHDRLVGSGHWSPTEHAAQSVDFGSYFGNFLGWKQYHKTFVHENKSGDLRSLLENYEREKGL